MKRCISVVLVLSLGCSLQLFSMYSGLRTLATKVGATRSLLSAQQPAMSMPEASRMSYPGVYDHVFQLPAVRRLHTTYSAGGSLPSYDSPADEGLGSFVQARQWRFDTVRPAWTEHIKHNEQSSSAPEASASAAGPLSLKASDFVQAFQNVQSEVSSRLMEDDQSIAILNSWEPYKPEPYSALSAYQTKSLGPNDYEELMNDFKKLNDVEVSRFSYTVDGQPVAGYALLPKKEPESGKHPLVVAFRGGFNGYGPFHEWGKVDLAYLVRQLVFYAKNGYAVLISQYRGAEGNMNKDEFGGADVRDVLGLFEVAREMGNIDLNDISFDAFSRGAVMAMKTLEALNGALPIKALITQNGLLDLETFIKIRPKLIKPILQQARSDFDTNTDAICHDLSFTNKSKLVQRIPTCAFISKNDGIVPATLTENFVQKLHDQGSEYAEYAFESKDHEILDYINRVQQLKLDWLNKQRNKKLKSSL